MATWPLEFWLEEARQQAFASNPEPRPWPDLQSVELLCQNLHRWGLSPPLPTNAVKLAVLVDCLDAEERLPPQAEALHQQWYRRSSVTAWAAACALSGVPGYHRVLAGLPANVTAMGEAIDELGQFQPLSDQDHVTCSGLRRQLDHRLRRAKEALFFRFPEISAATEGLSDRVAAALARAEQALELGGGCRRAWEVQRSGFLGRDLLLGDLFLPLIVLDAAGQGGLDVAPALTELLAGRRDDGLRYYRDCPEMPFDADVGAAVLLAARRVTPTARLPQALLRQARAIVRASIDNQGSVATWVCLPGEPEPVPYDRWPGQRCAAVAARVVQALCEDPSLVSPDELGHCAETLADQADDDGGFTGVFYPSRTVTTSLALRALQLLPPTLHDRHSLEQVRRGCRRWLLAQQGPDGSLGQHELDGAHALLALAHEPIPPAAALTEGVAALVGRQKCDGTWAGADYFLCPHSITGMSPIGNRAVTTALALNALARYQSCLQEKRAMFLPAED
jgi:hypothetical protein